MAVQKDEAFGVREDSEEQIHWLLPLVKLVTRLLLRGCGEKVSGEMEGGALRRDM